MRGSVLFEKKGKWGGYPRRRWWVAHRAESVSAGKEAGAKHPFREPKFPPRTLLIAASA